MSWLLAVVWLRTWCYCYLKKWMKLDNRQTTQLWNKECICRQPCSYSFEWWISRGAWIKLYRGIFWKVVSKMLWNRWRLYTCCSAICPIKMQYYRSSKDTTSWLQHISRLGAKHQRRSLRMFKAALTLTIGLTNEGRSTINGSRGKHKCFTKLLNRTLTLEKMKGTAVRQHLSHLAV